MRLKDYLNEAQGFFVVSKRKALGNDWIPGQRQTKKMAKIQVETLKNGVHSKDLTGLGIVKAKDNRDAVDKAKNDEWVEKYI